MDEENSAIPELVRTIVAKLMEIDAVMKKSSEESVSMDLACQNLSDLNRLKLEMSVMYDSAVLAVAEKMADLPEVTLADGTKLEKKTSYDRKSWKHDDLAGVVSRRIVQLSTDLETGEVSATPETVGKEILKYLQPSYWRIKALSGIGISADDYCEVSEESKTSVIIRRPKE